MPPFYKNYIYQYNNISNNRNKSSAPTPKQPRETMNYTNKRKENGQIKKLFAKFALFAIKKIRYLGRNF